MQDSIPCDHLCAFDCQTMLDAIEREESVAIFYERISMQCDYPDVHAFIAELAQERRASVKRLRERFNEINNRFDPAGC